MSSPCPPSTKPVTSSTETFSAWATNVRKRAVSRTPDCPKTRFFGKPDALYTAYVMASTGFVNTRMYVSGEYLTTDSVTEVIIPAFVLTRSSRLIPGLRAIPAVMMTRSEWAVSS